MENASKALLIAAGVLIAIIIISVFLTIYNRLSSVKKAQDEKVELEQLAAFNAEYESYNKSVMYGTDVVTLVNKANENNRKQMNGTINIYLTMNTMNNNNIQQGKVETIELKKENSGSETSYYGIITIGDTTYTENNFQTMIFKCDRMEHNDLGRVSDIYISKRN